MVFAELVENVIVAVGLALALAVTGIIARIVAMRLWALLRYLYRRLTGQSPRVATVTKQPYDPRTRLDIAIDRFLVKYAGFKPPTKKPDQE